MLVYYFVSFIVSNRYLLFWVSNGHNSVAVQNWTHVYMNFFDDKDLGKHLLQLCPKVVKHPICVCVCVYCIVNVLSFYRTQVLGSCCSAVRVIFLLRSGTIWLADWCPVCWHSIMVSSSRVKMPMDISTLADHCMVLKYQIPITQWQCHVPEEQRHEILWLFLLEL